jgi:hypothetical protein
MPGGPAADRRLTRGVQPLSGSHGETTLQVLRHLGQVLPAEESPVGDRGRIGEAHRMVRPQQPPIAVEQRPSVRPRAEETGGGQEQQV